MNHDNEKSTDSDITSNKDNTDSFPIDNLKQRHTKTRFIKKIIVLGSIFTIALAIIQYFLKPIISNDYIMLLQSIQVSIFGYFIIEIISNTFHDLTYDYLKDTSKSIKILIRILGAIIIIAIIISYLSNDPIVAASIGTISGLIVGFASQNIVGNIIAGLYLALTRPFKLGDEITAFSSTGIIFDIGLISTKLHTQDNKIVLVPNSSLVTTTVVLNKKN